jgi:flagellar basal-body rod modification protein FlgD
MPIDPTSATIPAVATTPSLPPTGKDQLGTDTFLNLLVAQLKYQNPMSPSDGTQFLAQTAQFTMVEKLTELTEQSKRLLTDNQSLAAASLLGKTVSWADADGAIQHGTVTSAAFGSEGATVIVGEQRIPFAQIRDVSAPAAAAAAPTSPPTTEAPSPDPGADGTVSPTADVTA